MGKKLKLPNGSGSVYKLSGNNRRKAYAVAITVGWDKNGKQQRKIIDYAADYISGMAILNNYKLNPYDLDLNKTTFSEIWLNGVVPKLEKMISNGKMSDGNLKALNSAFRVHLKQLHNKKILTIKKNEMQLIIDNSGIKRTGKGHIKTVCVKVFDFVIDNFELRNFNNIAENLDSGDRNESEERIPFSDNELSILWGMQFNDIAKIILIFCYTGLRPNELFKTKRECIFLNERYMITGSKTKAGKDRIIPIHSKIIHLIKYFYNNELELPFTSIIEKFNYGKFERRFNKLMQELNMDHIPYEGRHTFATKMKQGNANEYLLKIIMGHSIQDLTEKVYTHRKIDELINEIERCLK